MNETVDLRHDLHAHPELSGREHATAERLENYFRRLSPDEVVRGIGGTGMAFAFGDTAAGPTVMLRAELDALPIRETNRFAHRSTVDGCSHKCGHDGHMAILAAVGTRLAAQRPLGGRVVLLYQPAEETGAGARAVVDDPRYATLQPDRSFGLHNIPGLPLGAVVVRDGTFACASRGMRVRLAGTGAHAAQPETGRSPAIAMARIVTALSELPRSLAGDGELMFATVVGARMGGPDYGVMPGTAEVYATLRAETDATMARVVAYCEALARTEAAAAGLDSAVDYHDVFDATVNDPAAVATIRAACDDVALVEARQPFRWSEDFGCFTQRGVGAFFGLGAGEQVPDLHNDDYDFPDALIEIGADVFLRIVARCFEEYAA